MKSIAVLMTVFNRATQTIKCLDHLFNQPLPEGYTLKVYLTDDGCTDGTPVKVANRYPDVIIVQGDGTLYWNRGMWTAWNRAVRDFDYDFYLWLNDDTFLFDSSLLRLLEESDKYNNRNVIVGSTCAVSNPNMITYGGIGAGGLFTNLSVNHECDQINGNIVLIPYTVFHAIGMNDYRFRHCLGDTDYGLRAKELGIPCITAIGLYGECDLHDHITIWMDPSQPLIKRYKNFMSPLGNNPYEFFYFKRKHYGFLRASATFLTMWIHFAFPRLWANMGRTVVENNKSK